MSRAAPTASATSSTSASVSVRQSSSSRPSRTMPTTGGSPRRSGAASDSSTRAGEARQLRERKRAAADARDGLLDLAAGRAAPAARRARAPPAAGSRSIRSTGISLAARRGTSSSVPSSAASVSLSARSARWSGCRRSRSTSSARPATIPACGPPSSLSPEKQTRSAPAARLRAAVGSSPSSSERAGAEVVDERQVVRARDCRELGERAAAP